MTLGRWYFFVNLWKLALLSVAQCPILQQMDLLRAPRRCVLLETPLKLHPRQMLPDNFYFSISIPCIVIVPAKRRKLHITRRSWRRGLQAISFRQEGFGDAHSFQSNWISDIVQGKLLRHLNFSARLGMSIRNCRLTFTEPSRSRRGSWELIYKYVGGKDGWATYLPHHYIAEYSHAQLSCSPFYVSLFLSAISGGSHVALIGPIACFNFVDTDSQRSNKKTSPATSTMFCENTETEME
jgi:hypothetical protein